MPEGNLLISYVCPRCGCEWEDVWSSAVDADCNDGCGARDISPVSWEDMEEIGTC
jgi:hypothetical protein